ncbi:MAG TPA: DUF1579 domain-containing protein [Thermoanaerobaculia bacterium]|jgi:hypothetical protein|nr:DUF1579 domain-containing protein [Thermoanaerobaculia bacterium]
MKSAKGILAGLAFLIVIAALAIGADEKAKKTMPAAGKMDEKAMMEMMAKYSTPGEEHKKLESFVGTWDTTAKMWMEPGAPPQESKGVSENKMALGGRFLEQSFEGTMMNQPFTGKGYTGYDIYKKQYVGTWMDTMGTAIMSATGKADPSGKMITFTGAMDDPMSGKKMDFKEVVTLVDDDHHTFEMWMPGPDGKMFKMMEIQYTKRK